MLGFKVLGETCYRRILLFERPLDATLPPVRVRNGIELTRWTDAADVGSLQRLRPEISSDTAASRLANHEHGYVAWEEGQAVAVAWAARGHARIGYLGRTIELDPDDYYLYEVFVDPSHRGQGIAGALFAYAYQGLQAAGGRRAVFAVNLDNIAALRALTGAGERAYAIEGVMWLLGWRRGFRRAPPATVRSVRRSDTTHDSGYWDAVYRGMSARDAHYMDDLLATLKRRAYRRMLERWATSRPPGLVLKTDLFEEANGVDAIFEEVPHLGEDGIGMDVSSAVTRQARDETAGDRIVFVTSDVRHLPFATGSIAVVFSPSTLDHFAVPDELGRSLREIRRVLRPEGVLILTLDNRHNVLDPLLRLAGRAGRIPYFLGRSYSMRQMRGELDRAGFTVEDTTTLIQHPRLVGVAATRLARRVGWAPWKRLTRRAFFWAERLEHTPLKYVTGCFVAARAVPRSPE